MRERNNFLLKKLDYYIGIPILFILGILHSHKELPSTIPSRILLVKTAGIGDTVQLIGIIQELKNQLPNCRIDVVATKSNYSMVKLIKEVDNINLFDMMRPISSLKKIYFMGRYDLLFDFASWPRINAIISFFARANYKIGFKRSHMHRHYVYDSVINHSDDVHELVNYRHQLVAAKLKVFDLIPRLYINGDSPLKGEYAVFHLCPGGAKKDLKMWPIGNWLELSKFVYGKYGWPIIFTGGKDDSSVIQEMMQDLSEMGIKASNVAGRYKLDETAALLAHSQVLVSVDTGIMHMGSALDIPMVALMGPTSPKRWGPLSQHSIAVGSDDSCRPCISLGWDTDCNRPLCMDHISVRKVEKAIEIVLDGNIICR